MKISIVGITGYSGLELVKLLLRFMQLRKLADDCQNYTLTLLVFVT